MSTTSVYTISDEHIICNFIRRKLSSFIKDPIFIDYDHNNSTASMDIYVRIGERAPIGPIPRLYYDTIDSITTRIYTTITDHYPELFI